MENENWANPDLSGKWPLKRSVCGPVQQLLSLLSCIINILQQYNQHNIFISSHHTYSVAINVASATLNNAIWSTLNCTVSTTLSMWHEMHLKYSVRYLFCFSCSKLLLRTSDCSAEMLHVSFKLHNTTCRIQDLNHQARLHNHNGSYQHKFFTQTCCKCYPILAKSTDNLVNWSTVLASKPDQAVS